jgi:hypothetical protein
VIKRVLFLSALSVFAVHMPQALAATACAVNEIQRIDLRNNLCSQGDGLAAVRGCTALLMRSQVADQFEQMALAKRCGFNAEAEKLDSFYKKTTPLVIQLYECVDDNVPRAEIEKQAQDEVDKKLAAMPAGCPDDLKAKMKKRLPTLISVDKKSLEDVTLIGKQLGFVPQ